MRRLLILLFLVASEVFAQSPSDADLAVMDITMADSTLEMYLAKNENCDMDEAKRTEANGYVAELKAFSQAHGGPKIAYSPSEIEHWECTPEHQAWIDQFMKIASQMHQKIASGHGLNH